MLMRFLNILSSLMLSASCVNGLSSLDHKSLPNRAFPNSQYFIGSNSDSLAPDFFSNGDNFEITNDFLPFVNTLDRDFLIFKSLPMYYDRDNNYDSLLGKSIFRIYDSPSSVGHNFLDVYIDDYDVYQFGFVPILSEYFNPINYLMFITTDFLDYDNLSFYSVTYLYSFDAGLNKGGPNWQYPYNYYMSNLVGSKYNSYDFSYASSNLTSLQFTILMVHDIDLTTSNSYDLGYSNGYKAGYTDGNNAGYNAGYSTGYTARSKLYKWWS